MARSTKSYEERMLRLEKKEQESLEKAKQYAAQKRELKKRQKDVETKKRTHRLCQIGGAVESVLGSAIEEDDPKAGRLLKKAGSKWEILLKGNAERASCKYGGSVMPEGVGFPFPSLLFYEGRTYGQPEVVRISLPQVATGLRLRLPGSFRRRGFQPDLLMPQEALFARGAHSMQAVMHRALLRRGCSGRYHFLLGKSLPAGNQSRIRQNGGNGAWRFFIIQ